MDYQLKEGKKCSNKIKNLTEMSNTLLTGLEKEVNHSLEGTIGLLEPIIIICMAVGVGFIIMAIMMPMFAMNELI